MSLLNHLNIPQNENRHLSVKQFGVSNTQPVIKKKALADVGNTLHQKQSAGKPMMPLKKPGNIGENGLSIKSYKSESNQENPSTVIVNESILNSESDDAYVEPVCNCKIDLDDGDDILFNDIKLTKECIENLALNWQNPPVLSVKDKRAFEILSPLKVPTLDASFGCDSPFDDLFLQSLPGNTTPFEVPPPFFDLDDSFTGICL